MVHPALRWGCSVRDGFQRRHHCEILRRSFSALRCNTRHIPTAEFVENMTTFLTYVRILMCSILKPSFRCRLGMSARPVIYRSLSHTRCQSSALQKILTMLLFLCYHREWRVCWYKPRKTVAQRNKWLEPPFCYIIQCCCTTDTQGEFCLQ
jgi:hypothetical protein